MPRAENMRPTRVSNLHCRCRPRRCAKLAQPMAESPDAPQTILHLKLWLCDLKPLIWRSIDVPSDVTLPRLHRTIQVAMGWEDYHLHAFHIGRRCCEIPDPEDYLDALANPNHDQHDELLAWRGPFDPERFDLEAVNRALQNEFSRKSRQRSQV